jgi:hypothetical protein
LDDLQFGSKMVLLMDILKECELIGDKVTYSSLRFHGFSQYIAFFLALIRIEASEIYDFCCGCISLIRHRFGVFFYF